MNKEFFERKGVKTAFIWIIIEAIALVFFVFNGFGPGHISEYWILLMVMLGNIDRIVIPLANLPEPPGLFSFFTGLLPLGALIAYCVSLLTAETKAQQTIIIILLAAMLLWNLARIGWGILEKKKQNKCRNSVMPGNVIKNSTCFIGDILCSKELVNNTYFK